MPRLRLSACAAAILLLAVGAQFPTSIASAVRSHQKCTITGTGHRDHLEGTSGKDVICGRGGRDHIVGRGGEDIIRGGGADDYVDGGFGSDVLQAGRGDDAVAGGGGGDRLVGRTGWDRISGGDGHDSFSGGHGWDCLDAKDGVRDSLHGGSGNDWSYSDRGLGSHPADLRRDVEHEEAFCPEHPAAS